MKRKSEVRYYRMAALIILLVLAAAVVAVAGYSRKKKKDREKEQAAQETEAAPETTQTPTPEATPDPNDPAVKKAELVAAVKAAVDASDAQTVTDSLRYTAADGSAAAYAQEDVEAVILHLKESQQDYDSFLAVLESEATLLGEEGEASYLRLADANLRMMTNTEEVPQILTPEETNSNGKKVAIDPGHQGHGNSEQEPIGPGASQTKAKVASGTSGRTTGVPEYQLNLDVSLKLRDELTARGYEVYMIRETNDVDISNAERAQAAAESGADILVRIHANGSDNTSVAGALTMAPSTSNPYMGGDLVAECQKLSKEVIGAFCEATGANNQGVYQTDTMSGLNWCTIPATIVEMGYMTNPDEDRKMQTEEYQNSMVQGIANGIDQYFESGM